MGITASISRSLVAETARAARTGSLSSKARPQFRPGINALSRAGGQPVRNDRADERPCTAHVASREHGEIVVRMMLNLSDGFPPRKPLGVADVIVCALRVSACEI